MSYGAVMTMRAGWLWRIAAGGWRGRGLSPAAVCPRRPLRAAHARDRARVRARSPVTCYDSHAGGTLLRARTAAAGREGADDPPPETLSLLSGPLYGAVTNLPRCPVRPDPPGGTSEEAGRERRHTARPTKVRKPPARATTGEITTTMSSAAAPDSSPCADGSRTVGGVDASVTASARVGHRPCRRRAGRTSAARRRLIVRPTVASRRCQRSTPGGLAPLRQRFAGVAREHLEPQLRAESRQDVSTYEPCGVSECGTRR